MVMYLPKRGDIVWTNFDPAAGYEQKGKRPALILSPANFNKVFGLALAAPITSRARGHAFETDLNDPNIKIKGVVLCQQIKMIDFKERGLQYVAKAPGEVLNEVLGKARTILE
ncbi:MAG: mRNA-degrading endonuclease [Desulfobacteraceae bacterium 4572_89]|nr:MAG: mRNA-degrading endonuclease [Desulfobacteraceae bacterium 4572_89]